MFKNVTALCLAIVFPLLLVAQVLPKDGSFINYRIIGFSFPEKAKNSYVLEIARGTHFIEDSFVGKVFVKHPSKTNKLIEEVPSFGRDYTWRVVYTSDKKVLTKSPLHHFSTQYYKWVDSTQNRLRIIDSAKKYKSDFVFIEAYKAVYDMNGRPVWCLPPVDGVTSEYATPQDMQVTNQGTATFLYDGLAGYEINYNGKILFRTPKEGKVSTDTDEYIHHEFRRLSNGNYMTMGSELADHDRSFAAANDSTALYFPRDGRKKVATNSGYQKTPFGTVIEYNKKGQIVWSWRSANYFKTSDIFNHLTKGDYIDINAHENSFFFDEKAKMLYVGFRDISRVLKIKYPEGKVLKAYGETLKPHEREAGNGVFCKQHSLKVTSKGNILLYNNNACHFTGFPSVVMFDPNTSDGERINKVWEYVCPIEGEKGPTQSRFQFTYGGNVVELPGGDIFVSMSTLYCRSLIVSSDKKILWSAIPEHWNRELRIWENVMQYKASPVSRKDFEKWVWDQ